MSRNIKTTALHMDANERNLRDTASGKIVFTQSRGNRCAFYLNRSRLLAAQVMSDTANRIGAVYIGKVKNVVKNIDACFVEISDGEICFLSLRDADFPLLLNRKWNGKIIEGDELLVQLSREAQKTKQAALTARISLADDYAAVGIGPSHIGFSNKISKLRRQQIEKLLYEAGMQENRNLVQGSFPVSVGLVVRTKAKDCADDILLDSIRDLLSSLKALIETAGHRTCFSCIQEAPQDYVAVLNQLAYSYEYSEILTDDAILFEKLAPYCAARLPDKSVRLYADSSLSLSKLYSIEQKLDHALNTRVWLKSGGYLIIEPTEALTVIDVNTGKYEGKQASQDAYERINREAATEIALQLRLRNLSGIILVDFINMESQESKESLLSFLRETVNRDRVKTVVVDITPLGLVEITRKKQNRPLKEQFLADRK